MFDNHFKGGKYSKSSGKGATPKGKGKGGFQGHYQWCGEWGHAQARCVEKDKYMDAVRAGQVHADATGKGNGNGLNAVSLTDGKHEPEGGCDLDSQERQAIKS